MNKIPTVETRTAAVAAAVGRPKANGRAWSGACHCNPIAILQPLPPLVGSTGKLTGYACWRGDEAIFVGWNSRVIL